MEMSTMKSEWSEAVGDPISADYKISQGNSFYGYDREDRGFSSSIVHHRQTLPNGR